MIINEIIISDMLEYMDSVFPGVYIAMGVCIVLGLVAFFCKGKYIALACLIGFFISVFVSSSLSPHKNLVLRIEQKHLDNQEIFFKTGSVVDSAKINFDNLKHYYIIVQNKELYAYKIQGDSHYYLISSKMAQAFLKGEVEFEYSDIEVLNDKSEFNQTDMNILSKYASKYRIIKSVNGQKVC